MRAAELDASGSDASLFAFEPDAQRTLAVAGRVRAELGNSLEAVFRALGQERAASGQDLVARVRAGPIAPAVFGAYTELVEAIFADDNDTAWAIADALCAPGFGAVDGLRIVTLDDAQLGAGQEARYRRLVDDDQDVGTALRALDGAAFASAAQRMRDAIALLDTGAPELAGEVAALVHEIVVVDKPGDTPFGASSFQLWGTLFIKPKPSAGRVEIAEQLAHECAHALLFGFSMGRPLVENEPEELYASPLRPDPRPMDGVVHATYVIARMHYTVTRLLASGLLTQDEVHDAHARIERTARGYAEGVAVVQDQAHWTPPGEAALASAKAYMQAHASGG